MSLQQLRIMTLPVIGSILASYLSGDLALPLLFLVLGSLLPLFAITDLEAVRNHGLWKWYGALTFVIVVLFYVMQISMKYSIFFLVFFCIIYEFYGERRPRAPARLLALLSFLVLLYHARVEAGLGLFVGVLIYLLSLVLCLILSHATTFFDERKLGLRMLAGVPHFVVIFVMGMLLFWAMPRFPHQNLSAIPSLLGSRTSGFANRVNLNDIGSLKRSRKHIMDVLPLDGRLHDPYIKGRVLDYYHQGTWSTTAVNAQFPGPGKITQMREMIGDDKVYRYRIDLQPLHGNTIFYLDNLISLKGDLYPMKAMSGLDHIAVIRPLPVALSYTVSSTDRPVYSSLGRGLNTYGQMSSETLFFGEIARDILAPLENPTVPEVAAAFQNYFQDNFEYSLDVNNQGKEPLQYFMQNARSGHCELFASSMIFLLRSQGIGARLVTGFLLTQKHPGADFYHVTESDAHAWVEYYHQNAWHKLDPTPPAEYVPPGFLAAKLADLNYLWRKAVMTFDYESQRDVTTTIQLALRRLIDGVFAAKGWVVLLTGVLILGYLGRLFLFGSQKPDQRLIRLYRKLEQRLAASGRDRQPDEGMADYIQRMSVEPSLKHDLLGFLTDYQRFRFAPRSGAGAADLIRRLRLLLLRLRNQGAAAS